VKSILPSTKPPLQDRIRSFLVRTPLALPLLLAPVLGPTTTIRRVQIRVPSITSKIVVGPRLLGFGRYLSKGLPKIQSTSFMKMADRGQLEETLLVGAVMPFRQNNHTL
jgi:hypothetical protein